MAKPKIDLPKQQLAAFCRRWRIREHRQRWPARADWRAAERANTTWH